MKYAKKVKLVYSDFPFTVWSLGILMIFLGLVILIRILLVNWAKNMVFAVIASMILIAGGVGFLMSAKIKRITFDKKEFKMTIENLNFICRKKMCQHSLEKIDDLIVE